MADSILGRSSILAGKEAAGSGRESRYSVIMQKCLIDNQKRIFLLGLNLAIFGFSVVTTFRVLLHPTLAYGEDGKSNGRLTYVEW